MSLLECACSMIGFAFSVEVERLNRRPGKTNGLRSKPYIRIVAWMAVTNSDVVR